MMIFIIMLDRLVYSISNTENDPSPSWQKSKTETYSVYDHTRQEILKIKKHELEVKQSINQNSFLLILHFCLTKYIDNH